MKYGMNEINYAFLLKYRAYLRGLAERRMWFCPSRTINGDINSILDHLKINLWHLILEFENNNLEGM